MSYIVDVCGGITCDTAEEAYALVCELNRAHENELARWRNRRRRRRDLLPNSLRWWNRNFRPRNEGDLNWWFDCVSNAAQVPSRVGRIAEVRRAPDRGVLQSVYFTEVSA